MSDDGQKQGKTLRFTRLPEGDSFRETHLSLQVEGEELPYLIDVPMLQKLLQGEHREFTYLRFEERFGEGDDHAE